MPDRAPLELIMFAAWVNVPVDELPPTMRGHTCPTTIEAWKRVADAAKRFIRGELNPAKCCMVDAARVYLETHEEPNEVKWHAEELHVARAIQAAISAAPVFNEVVA